IPFKARVFVTDRFVSDVLEYVAGHAEKVMSATRGADAQVVAWGLDPAKAPAMGVRFDFDSRGTEPVLLEKLTPNAPRPEPTSRPKAVEGVRMPVYDRFKVTKTAPFPAAYVIPASETATVALLRKHGIIVERLTADSSGDAALFSVSKVAVAPRPFQGHRLVTLDGEFLLRREILLTGSFVVRTAQPLGILAFHMLEPESQDGVIAWGEMAAPTAGNECGVVKVMQPLTAATERVP
ncbi:MAG TPA: hypothetical protein VKT78_01695, partial [Fimbriimonadaceae bacterium]|nr:hypothetical protein [Fimbriimonadaceae bacterium]